MESDKIFELMTKMYADLKQSQKKMYSEMQNGFESVNKKIGDLEKKVDKNTLMLEKQEKNIQLLSEGHKNLSEQMDRKFTVSIWKWALYFLQLFLNRTGVIKLILNYAVYSMTK